MHGKTVAGTFGKGRSFTGVNQMERSSYLSGTPWESQVGYSRAVRVGPHVFVTGTTATIADGHVGDGDAEAQAKQALANIVTALE